MSADLRNSIYAWLSVIAIAAFFWAGLHFHLADAIPKGWMMYLGGVAVVLFNFGRFGLRLWRRRAKPAQPSPDSHST